ncbi:PEP-CTERM sorting domain-containing protein [Janthinobacterium rivuli]|uniref:NF038129 family PEP-CTERM protein n=1 Tax=Janthinobacterium sp. FT68W TaxID=2654255 RepID=UPI00126573BC|nr:NF038129 family PEP-CTERM protein [Janthinobacterium sp. FT68W]KAB8051512.1 PEP-CTERM sorting domain-containing protein [Janthinobacterium sp. FT68W]
MFAPTFNLTLRRAVLAALLAGSSGLALADPLAYRVEIDTSQFSGAGFLDFAFIAGNSPAPGASAVLSNFSGAFGALASQEGNVSGSVPGTLTFGNGGAYNDWFHNVTLGGKFGFNIVFGGDFLNTAGNAGTTFGVGLLDYTGMAYLGNANGNLLQFELTPLNGGLPASIAGSTYASIASISAVPEASEWMMLTGGLALIGFALRRRQPVVRA